MQSRSANGKPMQNGFNERFNGSYRKGVLDRYVFGNLTEVREHTEIWLRDSNQEIPHDSLNDLTPVEYRQAGKVDGFSLHAGVAALPRC